MGWGENVKRGRVPTCNDQRHDASYDMSCLVSSVVTKAVYPETEAVKIVPRGEALPRGTTTLLVSRVKQCCV